MEAVEEFTSTECLTLPQEVSSDQEGAVYLSEVSPWHAVWDRRKADADTIAGIYAQAADQGFLRYAERVGRCSETLLLSECLSLETGEIGFKTGSAKCRARHCPICQSVRMKGLRERLEKEVLPRVVQCFPGGRWLFLTLTVRNCGVAELRQTIQVMNQAWHRLVKREEWQVVAGWLRSVEVTKGKDGPMQAHPHFHVLLLVPPSYFTGKRYIKQAKWVKLWQDCARLNYTPSVYIKPVDAVKGGLVEVLKVFTYSVKPAELADNPAWFHELHRQVHKLRFLAAGGLVKEIMKGIESLAGDIAEGWDLDGLETGRQLVFDWYRPVKRYRKRDPS